jgi:hypothetical protein
MNASELKLRLLIEGIALDYASFDNLSFKADKYLHNDRHFAPKDRKNSIPQDLLLNDGIHEPLCVGVLSRPQSPLRLTYQDGALRIILSGTALDIEIRFLREPCFWAQLTSDGIPMFKLLSIPGSNELNLWTWHDCAYHYEKMGCSFCTTTATAVRGGTGRRSALATAYDFIVDPGDGSGAAAKILPTLLRRSTETLQAALRSDFADGEYWFTIIGGNVPNSKLPAQHGLIRGLISGLLQDVDSLRADRIVANVMVPDDERDLTRLRNAGASVLMANLEVWDQTEFERICPGKAAYGRGQFLHMLEAAAAVFGAGLAWSNFVCGLEPMNVQLEGVQFLAERGVVAGANVFHRDPFVRIAPDDGFSIDSVHQYYIDAANILRAHNLVPFYSISSRRSSLLWEAYHGYLT